MEESQRQLLGELIDVAHALTCDEFVSRYPHMALLHKGMENHAPAQQLDTEVLAVNGQGDKSASVLERMLGLATARDLYIVQLVRGERSLFADRISVGRTSATDLCFPHSEISKYHAYFTSPRPGVQPTLTDADSKNGTFVLGNRLPANIPVPLADRTVIRFGEFNVRFHLADGLWRALHDYTG